ncbi:MAG: tRNA uridine-5-carboxymethylaminomethyl(34) synthesis enzyme MnmG [Erysipelotrichaceae bacterium]
MKYDVIVVGGGHAGIEACLVAARMAKKTLLITLNKNMIGSMPCNPSIGGPAKGIVVREIDALGGQMGINADKTALQFKMLNTTKGPGVQSLRVQSDRLEYVKLMIKTLEKQENLEILEAMVKDLIVENNTIIGVKTNKDIYAKTVILTTGTFLTSKIMVSDQVTEMGPENQPTTSLLTKKLNALGINTFRLKTGTPPRVKTSSIDFVKTTLQAGSEDFLSFSYLTTDILPFKKQLPCYLTYTNEQTHKIINDNLSKSSMYSGVVKGVGPRYCPSIEDKLVRFSDKERHQIFLEPETADNDLTYIQGFSTSLPYDIQEAMVHSLVGLEKAEIVKYAYAIEYDAIDPLQLKATLESKKINNLYSAGQINGTSGYEEAAGQGLMAGINAVLKLDKKKPFILNRDEAYIGVMIDDLITKGTQEPYRLLTSRAEYRLLLRHDNADVRLSEKAYQIGSINQKRYDIYLKKQKAVKLAFDFFNNTKAVSIREISDYLKSFNWEKPLGDNSLLQIIKRPHVEILKIKEFMNLQYDNDVLKQIEISAKYEGYINKAKREAQKLKELDNIKIPEQFNYDTVLHLSLEARQKLSTIRPTNLAQASRISGINPSDISTLLIYLKI